MSLMTAVSPHLESLKKEGQSGRTKINQYTRYGTLLLGTVQGYGVAVGLESSSNVVIDPGTFFTIALLNFYYNHYRSLQFFYFLKNFFKIVFGSYRERMVIITCFRNFFNANKISICWLTPG